MAPVRPKIELPAEAVPIGGQGLTARQRRRYVDIVNSTLRLIDSMGATNVRMEFIADESETALATIYRYFLSRDRLIFLACDAWLRHVVRTVRAESDDENPLRLMLHAMQSADAIFQARPQILRAWVMARLSKEPHTLALTRNQSFFADMNAETFARLGSPGLVQDLTTIMEGVWFGRLVTWVIEDGQYSEVTDSMAHAVRLVFRSHGMVDPDQN